jgi:hypothetical protein
VGSPRSQVLADADREMGKKFAIMYVSPPVALMVSWYTLSHSARLVDPSYFSIPDCLKFRGQHTLFKSREKALTPASLHPLTGECDWWG